MGKHHAHNCEKQTEVRKKLGELYEKREKRRDDEFLHMIMINHSLYEYFVQSD